MGNHEQTLEGQILLWAADWITVLLLLAGLLFPCLSAYGISDQYGFDRGAVMAFCVFGSAAAALLFTWKHGYWGVLAVLAAEGLVFWRLWVHMKEDWLLIRPPELADLFQESSGALFLLYVLAALALAWTVVKVRVWWLAAAIVILPVLPAIQMGVLPSWGSMLAGFAGWGSMLLTGLYGRKDPGSLGRARFLSLAGMGALILILVMSLPMEGYLRPQWATNAREELIRGVSRRLERFFDSEELENNLLTQLGLDLTIEGEGPGNGYGWGGTADSPVNTGMDQREDLLKVGPRRFAERLLLRMTTDQPNASGRYYLRGASFGEYTGASWESSKGLNGFQPERFPVLTAPDAQFYTMRIQDTAFGGTWSYPYRYSGGGELDEHGRLTKEWEIDDLPLEYWTMSSSWEKMPSVEYEISYCPGGPESGFIPLEGSGEAEENAYRYGNPYFYNNYLFVPQETRDALASRVDEIPNIPVTVDGRLPEQFRTAVTAAAQTASYLASAAIYDPDTPAMEAGEDFVTHFLEEGRGFCVHFATAGAVLLRMQGIPARYVNGYVAEMNGGGMALVMDSDAHAWVEIYLDGYGWYPVDMTPGYAGGISGVGLESAAGTEEPSAPEEQEEDVSNSEEEESGGETSEETGGETWETLSSEAGEGPEEEPVKWKIPAVVWKALFGAAVFWAVLCAAYLLAQAARERAKKDGNTNRSVLNAYGRYKRLRRWGCGEDDELERLAKKAKFSQHTLTAEERETAWKCLDEDLRQSRVGQPVRRRWMLALLTPIF